MKHYSTYQSQFIEMFGTIDDPKVEVKKLIDVSLASGQYGSNTPATKYHKGSPRYIRITDINDDGSLNDDIKGAEEIDLKYKLAIGDIVFARTGATVGKTYLHESGEAIYAGYLIKYQMNDSIMRPKFIKAFTHSKPYYNWVAKTQKVGAQPNISATQYDTMPVLVPELPEQDKFLSVYEQADKSKFTSLKSQFIEMFGGIQNDSKWPLKSLGELCEMVNGYAFKSTKYSESGYSIIRIANVQKGSIDDSDKVYYSEQHKDEFSDSILKEGDILISLTGNVGRAGVIYNKHLPAALNQRVQGLRIKNASELNHQYLFSLLNLDSFEELCIKNASGSAQLNLSTVWLRNCKIVCPRIEEQTKFALIAHQADKSKYIN